MGLRSSSEATKITLSTIPEPFDDIIERFETICQATKDCFQLIKIKYEVGQTKPWTGDLADEEDLNVENPEPAAPNIATRMAECQKERFEELDFLRAQQEARLDLKMEQHEGCKLVFDQHENAKIRADGSLIFTKKSVTALAVSVAKERKALDLEVQQEMDRVNHVSGTWYKTKWTELQEEDNKLGIPKKI